MTKEIDLNSLRMSRAKDREIACEAITKACLAVNPAVTVERCTILTDREINLTITGGRGAQAHVTLDADHMKHSRSFYIPWTIHSESDACFARTFWSPNEFHRRKASMILSNIGQVIHFLTQALEQTFDGTAFDPEWEKAYVAEHGTAKDRMEAMRAWMNGLEDEKGAAA